MRYAFAHPDQIERLVIFNAPIHPSARLPWAIRQFGIPLVGDMLTQDPLLVDRTLETGGIYRVPDKDLDVYRRPFLTTSASGRALLATVQNLGIPKESALLADQFAQWTRPTLVAWGMQDPSGFSQDRHLHLQLDLIRQFLELLNRLTPLQLH